jgi:uncharacterized protein (TIGR02391 family)
LTPDDLRAAIPRLRQRIQDLDALDPATVNRRDDRRIETLSKKIDQTLADVFGSDSEEFGRYKIWSLDRASRSFYHEASIEEVREELGGAIEQSKANMQSIIELFEERLGVAAGAPGASAKEEFRTLQIHPEIRRAAERLFADGHYANAIEDACKALDLMVRLRSGRDDLSGTELMQKVFSANTPILRYSDLTNDTERSEQQGMMHLFIGAVQAVRNPRAHALLDDDPNRAVEMVEFLSFLAYSLDRTRRV